MSDRTNCTLKLLGPVPEPAARRIAQACADYAGATVEEILDEARSYNGQIGFQEVSYGSLPDAVETALLNEDVRWLWISGSTDEFGETVTYHDGENTFGADYQHGDVYLPLKLADDPEMRDMARRIQAAIAEESFELAEPDEPDTEAESDQTLMTYIGPAWAWTLIFETLETLTTQGIVPNFHEGERKRLLHASECIE